MTLVDGDYNQRRTEQTPTFSKIYRHIKKVELET